MADQRSFDDETARTRAKKLLAELLEMERSQNPDIGYALARVLGAAETVIELTIEDHPETEETICGILERRIKSVGASNE